MNKIGLIFFVSLICASTACRQRGSVSVSFKNNTRMVLPKVHVKFTGGEYSILDLAPLQENVHVIKPTGESDIQLNIAIGTSTYNKTVDIYLEQTSTGSISIKFDGPNRIQWTDNIRTLD